MLQKIGKCYLDLSHAREINFKETGDATSVQIVWANGDWDRYQGEEAKALAEMLKAFEENQVVQEIPSDY